MALPFNKIYLTQHALQRLSERLGYLCWEGTCIKIADDKTKKRFVFTNINNNNLKIYIHHENNLIITTKFFSALGYIQDDLFFIETILY